MQWNTQPKYILLCNFHFECKCCSKCNKDAQQFAFVEKEWTSFGHRHSYGCMTLETYKKHISLQWECGLQNTLRQFLVFSYTFSFSFLLLWFGDLHNSKTFSIFFIQRDLKVVKYYCVVQYKNGVILQLVNVNAVVKTWIINCI